MGPEILKYDVTDRAGGPMSSPAVGRNLLLVTTETPLARLVSTSSCQRVGDGSSVGCGVGWLVNLHRGVGGWFRPTPSACLFAWSYSGNSGSHDGSNPCAVQWVNDLYLDNMQVIGVP